MSNLVPPHGGTLVDQFVQGADAEALRARAPSLPRITLDARELADLELIATGAVSPITGFLGSKDYTSVLERMRLADGTVWPLPLTLAVTAEVKAALDGRFGTWRPTGAAGAKVFPATVTPSGPKIVLVDRPDSPQSAIFAGIPTGLKGTQDLLPIVTANDALGGSAVSSTDKLILLQRLTNDQQNKLATSQLLSEAIQVEKPYVLTGAHATRVTARSRRNSVVVAALIGLVLGAIVALLWDGVAAGWQRRRIAQ